MQKRICRSVGNACVTELKLFRFVMVPSTARTGADTSALGFMKAGVFPPGTASSSFAKPEVTKHTGTQVHEARTAHEVSAGCSQSGRW